MSRVQLIEVAEGDGDQRLDRWFRRLFPQVSQGRLEKLCRKGEIRVDGGRVKAASRLQVGQSVRIPPLPDQAAPARPADSKISPADAALMRELVCDREKVTLKVATFDMKALEEQLEAKGDVSEDDIKAWLEEKPEAEKNRLQIYDTNRVALVMGISRFEQFVS